MPEFDELAEIYDRTRGGEERGDQYAADVAARLPAGEGPVLEVGVGTGVVALGLMRRGFRVIGLDVCSPMLTRARLRLGPVVMLGDAMEMPLAASSVAHAVSVWVLQAVAEPERVFREVGRVLRPGGRYVVCTTQWAADDDVIGKIIEDMVAAVDARRGGRPRGVTAAQALDWARPAGFAGDIASFDREYRSTPVAGARRHHRSGVAGSAGARRGRDRDGHAPGGRGTARDARCGVPAPYDRGDGRAPSRRDRVTDRPPVAG